MDYPGKVITKNQVTPTQTSASGNWTLDDAAAAIKNNNWPVALVPNPISKSLRFNSADTAYLNKTLTTPTNNKIFTFSAWVKRSALGAAQTLFDAFVPATSFDTFRFNSSDQLDYFDNTAGYLTSTQVFRDVSAWYHVMAAVDTTQATSSNRVKLYVNGTQITAFSATAYPSQNQAVIFNSAVAHNIGRFGYSANAYLNGYLTEINLIDGQQLTPSSFGMTNPQTGQWIPIKYSGTYGTNGFYLNFKDATSTTTLGYDYSGNANNWTTNNFSVTAGSGNDSLTDVPTPWLPYNTTGDVGGVVRGNYATWSPLAKPAASSTSNGNLTAVTTTAADERIFSTIAVSSGKWYWEVTPTAISSGGCMVAVTSSAYEYKTANLASGDDGYGYYTTGNKYNPSTATSYGNTFTTNDVIGVALDMDNGKIYFSKNGTFQNSGDPVAGTNAAFTSISGTYAPSISNGGATSSCTVEANFGQRPFAYTPPTGFRSLCTTNLPATTIGFGLTNQAGKYFNPVLYTGNGSTQSITGVGFQPDFVWAKSRNNSGTSNLVDAVRGTTKYLFSNLTNAEGTSSDKLTSFDSDGFSLGSDATGTGVINLSGYTMVAWNWKANGAGGSNTAGTITSTVSANTTSGFSVVTWTGSASASNQTVGHGLGSTPNMVILKNRSVVDNWFVYHSSATTNTQYLNLNTTAAVTTAGSNTWGAGMTSTLVGLRPGTFCSSSSDNVVMYCFAAVAGYSAFGSYTGNASTDGPFIYTGFRPRFVLIKRTDTTNDWFIIDTSRNTYNVAGTALFPNSTSSETTNGFYDLDIISNGFKARTSNAATNASSGTYLYAAFAESPFQFANAR